MKMANNTCRKNLNIKKLKVRLKKTFQESEKLKTGTEDLKYL